MFITTTTTAENIEDITRVRIPKEKRHATRKIMEDTAFIPKTICSPTGNTKSVLLIYGKMRLCCKAKKRRKNIKN